MRTPFDSTPQPLPTAARPASTKSRQYAHDLMLDKAAALGETEEDARARIRHWLGLNPSQDQVSEAIGRLKAEGFTGRKFSFQTGPEPAPDEVEEGFYEVEGYPPNEPVWRIIKIQRAVHGSGNLYGKELDVHTGRFEKITGAVRLVRERGTRLTTERARELGQLYGMCLRCGATLTDEDSIDRGMGPVCAAKGF